MPDVVGIIKEYLNTCEGPHFTLQNGAKGKGIVAALTADGYQVVPVEPSEAMLHPDIPAYLFQYVHTIDPEDLKIIYKAMLTKGGG